MADWVVIVDDDITNLKVSGTILSRAGMRVTALASGQALLDCVKKKGAPALILLDINMPEMDGFETLRMYRELEKENGIPAVPVIFLTADDDSASESRGFDMGVSDYIRKPINPDILVRRVGNIVKTYGQMLQYEESARTDKLTGFLNKAAATERITELCSSESGCLCTVDLDSFKLVNDLYGHDAGDQVLQAFAGIMKECLKYRGTFGRIGGDEFLIFCHDLSREAELARYTENINKRMLEEAKRIMGEQMEIPLGASVGAVFVPENGTVFEELFHLCDKMLYAVKKDGKHTYRLYTPLAAKEAESEGGGDINLNMLSQILEERSIPKNAMWIGREAFGDIYRYMVRYMKRYQGTAYKLLVTVEFPPEEEDPGLSPEQRAEEKAAVMDRVREILQASLRNSDIMMQIGENHFFLLLPEINHFSLNRVLERIEAGWEKDKDAERIRLDMDAESIYSDEHEKFERGERQQEWVAVVDDDPLVRQQISTVLKRNDMRVTELASGREFLDFMQENEPDLILLDMEMPGMGGFEAMEKLRSSRNSLLHIPLIFLTEEEDEETVNRGLSLGAMDFIRKPVVPGSLVMRIKHMLELVYLQGQFSRT